MLIYNDKYITQGAFLNAMVLSVGQLDIYKEIQNRLRRGSNVDAILGSN